MIQVGKLNQYIELYEAQDVDDGQGGRERQYVYVASFWGELLRPRFVQGNIQGGIAVDMTQGIRLRAGIAAKTGWQVRFDNRVFTVLFPPDTSVAGEIILTCREVSR